MARLNRSKLDGDDRSGSDLSTAEPTESTRLLGASVEESRNEAVTEDTNGGWDGLADFDGLPWWHRPSVSVNGPLPDHFPLTTWAVGILVTGTIFGFHPRFWECDCAKVELVSHIVEPQMLA